MLKLENVTKYLHPFCLESISFELPDGYILGLAGENGAGKTTLLRLLAGLYRKDSGSLVYNGMDYEAAEADIRQQVGTVFQEDFFDSRGTLGRNARRYGAFYRDYDASLLKSCLEQFGLDAGMRYGQLSKGEKLKFAFAFALSHRPKLLLLDEPTANFDRKFRERFRDILKKYTETGENSVILSTHITSDLDRIADYLLYLEKGRVLLYSDIESIRSDYRMVAGEAYKIKLLKDRVVHMEKGEFGAKALVQNCGKPCDPVLKVWEPSVEELMYHMAKKTVDTRQRK